jgi:hypothetical protein
MVTLITALISLVDEWKQHVGSGVPIFQVLGRIDGASTSELLELTSDSSTRRIASALESSLAEQDPAAVEAAEDLAEQYGTKRSLVAETTLEEFLTEIWPKAAPRTRPSRSARTRVAAGTAFHLAV